MKATVPALLRWPSVVILSLFVGAIAYHVGGLAPLGPNILTGQSPPTDTPVPLTAGPTGTQETPYPTDTPTQGAADPSPTPHPPTVKELPPTPEPSTVPFPTNPTSPDTPPPWPTPPDWP